MQVASLLLGLHTIEWLFLWRSVDLLWHLRKVFDWLLLLGPLVVQAVEQM
jgi:hypothetical protein